MLKGVIFKEDEKGSAFVAVTYDLEDNSKRRAVSFPISRYGWRKAKNMAEKYRLQ